MHASEEFIVIKNLLPEKVPIFNRGVYLENKQKVGIIDDVFGPINEFMFSVKCDSGIKPDSFKPNQKVIHINKISYIWIQCAFYPSKDSFQDPKEKNQQVEEAEVEEEVEEVEQEVEEVVIEVDLEEEEVIEEVSEEVLEEEIEVDLEEEEVIEEVSEEEEINK
jgi:rRNA processing protein Gar1